MAECAARYLTDIQRVMLLVNEKIREDAHEISFVEGACKRILRKRKRIDLQTSKPQ